MQIIVTIKEKDLEYLMGDCDSNYWAKIKHEDDKVFVCERDLDESKPYPEPGPWIELTEERRKAGLQLMADKYPKHFADFITDKYDSSTGDVWLQLAVLGEIKYG